VSGVNLRSFEPVKRWLVESDDGKRGAAGDLDSVAGEGRAPDKLARKALEAEVLALLVAAGDRRDLP
jgi:hypothetical protein